MKLLCHLALVLAVLHCSEAGMTWRICDDNSALFVPDKVTLSPDPPVIGDDVVFTIQGKAGQSVESGALDITVSYGGAEIFAESKDLCGRTSCPIKPGPIDIVYKQELPPIAPPGPYSVQVAASSDSGDQLMCIVVDFTLVPPGASLLTKAYWGGRKSGSSATAAV